MFVPSSYLRFHAVRGGLLLAAVLAGCSNSESHQSEAADDSAPVVVAGSSELTVSSAMKLEVGEVKSVSNTWTTVTVGSAYTAMVVIATPAYTSESMPLVTRIRNASGSSFQLRVDRFDGKSGAVAAVPVQYLVVEAGTYNVATHGIKLEAARFTSTITDRANSWNGQVRSYQNSYDSPVVLGQVMSYSDARPSVFWSRGAAATSPPRSSSLRLGKHVGEDPATSRANETIGYIVVETGSGSLGGITWEARLGADIVKDVTTPAATYPLTNPGLATLAVLSQSAMDGSEGSWSILAGPEATTGSTLQVHVDEDNVRDSERSHASEQVAYFVINQCPSNAAAGQRCGSGGACQSDGRCCSDADLDGVCDTLDHCPGFDDRKDADQDGQPDDCDGCPSDSSKTAVGICGCGNPDIDTDADGIADCQDGCAMDPSKTQPGICGCGTSDLDTDADGTADCHDACANDASKIQPGLCGCAVPDVDTDSDGTPDCTDLCPASQLKTQPGICGCETADTDMDHDGEPDCVDRCPLDNPDDADGDTVCNSADRCPGFDDRIDLDGDGFIDGCEPDPATCVAGLTGPGVYSGSLWIDGSNTASGLAKLANKWCVTGYLAIYGTNLTDLSALSQLTAVGAAFSIGSYSLSTGNSQLTSLHGLEHLKRVSGTLEIYGAPLLNDLSALSGLTSLDSLYFDRLPKVSSLPFMSHLTRIPGNILLRSMGALTSLADLSSLQELTGYLSVTQTGIANLNGLETLETLGSLYLGDNINLVSLSGLPASPRHLDGLSIAGSPRLSSLEPLRLRGATGSVVLNDLGVSQLSQLSEVESIGGLLVLYNLPNLQSLTGLERVTQIGSVLELEYLPRITSLRGLDSLSSAGKVLIQSNDSLVELTGLDSLTSVAGDMSIGAYGWNRELSSLAGLERLQSVGGNVTISAGEHLTSLEPLANLRTVGGGLFVSGSGILNLRGLQGINSVGGGLSISDTSIVDLQGLPTVAAVESLALTQHPRLVSLNGLTNLTRVSDRLSIRMCPELTSLQGLEGLTSVGNELSLGELPQLQDLVPLSALSSAGWISLSNIGITSLAGLSNLQQCSGLSLQRNPNLRSLSGPNQLTFIGGSLEVMSNPLLVDFTGLEGLTGVFSLGIGDNAGLLSLAGLDALTSRDIRYVWIGSNPVLPQCEVDLLVQSLATTCSGCSGNNGTGTCE